MLPNSNCKLSNIEVTELAVCPHDGTKACCVLQANTCHIESEPYLQSQAWEESRSAQQDREEGQSVEAGKKVYGTARALT